MHVHTLDATHRSVRWQAGRWAICSLFNSTVARSGLGGGLGGGQGAASTIDAGNALSGSSDTQILWSPTSLGTSALPCNLAKVLKPLQGSGFNASVGFDYTALTPRSVRRFW